MLDEAEAFGAILVVDEADALFSRRTTVSDAHERYSNLEAFYLQRLEHRPGVPFLSARDCEEPARAIRLRTPGAVMLERGILDLHPRTARSP